MGPEAKTAVARGSIDFERHPDRYKHWKLEFDGEVARLGMDVDEGEAFSGDYALKLNSYDLGVDIELADAIQRIRFEHPEVKTVVIHSLKDRIFCAGANIFMLGTSAHPFKVNFCKFTNETRLSMEDASRHSGLKFLCAVNGTCAGGGYELALACDEILLIDDGSSVVSLPETPLLGVLPGTGGLTRVTDKRKIRRDRADFFCSNPDGIKGKKAVEWGLVDGLAPRSQWDETIAERAKGLAAASDRPGTGGPPGVTLAPLSPKIDADRIEYKYVTGEIERGKRLVTLTVKGPEGEPPDTSEGFLEAGSDLWHLRAFRELDDAILRLRLNEPEIGTVLLKTAGDGAKVLAHDAALLAHKDHGFVREVLGQVRRTLKRIDVTSRTFLALIETGSCFAGSLFELALAADRSYMLDDPEDAPSIALSGMNAGPLPMGNDLTRLQTRFLGEPGRVDEVLGHDGPFDPAEAEATGLVTFAPDDIDWEDDVRLAIEERASLSPDALTGMESNLRFPGPETMETRIFGRLSAWQNWIFQRPNAVGEKGALRVYGQAGQRPDFDWKRT